MVLDGTIYLIDIHQLAFAGQDYQQWEEQSVWLKIWPKFLSELDQQGQLDWAETFADGSCVWAKKGAQALERPKAERRQSGWWWSAAEKSCPHHSR